MRQHSYGRIREHIIVQSWSKGPLVLRPSIYNTYNSQAVSFYVTKLFLEQGMGDLKRDNLGYSLTAGLWRWEIIVKSSLGKETVVREVTTDVAPNCQREQTYLMNYWKYSHLRSDKSIFFFA